MKVLKLKLAQRTSSQEGVSLLLAIIVLSSIMAVSFSIATILLVEINTSGDLIRSNNAFYAGLAQSEDGIFRTARGVSGLIPSPVSINSINVNTIAAATTSPNQVLAIKSGQDYAVDLIDPTNNYGGGNYTEIDITVLGPTTQNANLDEYLTEYPTTYSQTTPVEVLVASLNINSVASYTYFLNSTSQYHLRLHNNASTDLYVLVQAFIGSHQAYGLPLFHEKSLQIDGTNGDVTRHIEVTVPQK